jgi:hypothetical protein
VLVPVSASRKRHRWLLMAWNVVEDGRWQQQQQSTAYIAHPCRIYYLRPVPQTQRSNQSNHKPATAAEPAGGLQYNWHMNITENNHGLIVGINHRITHMRHQHICRIHYISKKHMTLIKYHCWNIAFTIRSIHMSSTIKIQASRKLCISIQT